MFVACAFAAGAHAPKHCLGRVERLIRSCLTSFAHLIAGVHVVCRQLSFVVWADSAVGITPMRRAEFNGSTPAVDETFTSM